MTDIKKIADEADLIVNGYAFTILDNKIKVLNLNFPDNAVILSKDGNVLETNMQDIEISIVKNYLEQNRSLMEL